MVLSFLKRFRHRFVIVSSQTVHDAHRPFCSKPLQRLDERHERVGTERWRDHDETVAETFQKWKKTLTKNIGKITKIKLLSGLVCARHAALHKAACRHLLSIMQWLSSDVLRSEKCFFFMQKVVFLIYWKTCQCWATHSAVLLPKIAGKANEQRKIAIVTIIWVRILLFIF